MFYYYFLTKILLGEDLFLNHYIMNFHEINFIYLTYKPSNPHISFILYNFCHQSSSFVPPEVKKKKLLLPSLPLW